MRKKASILIYILSFIVLTIIQTSFLPQFNIMKIKPDLVLLFVISAGLLKGCREGAIAGLLGGLITGIISANPWGLYLLGYSMVGFTAGFVTEKVEPDNFIVPLLSGLVGSLGFTFIFSSVAILFDLLYITSSDLYNSLIFLVWNEVFILPIFYLCKYVLLPPGRELDLSESLKVGKYTIQ